MTEAPIKGGANAAIHSFPLTDNRAIPFGNDVLYTHHNPSDDDVREMNSAVPMPVLHPARLMKTASRFSRAFSGETMYAVKCNPDPLLLRAMYMAGVRRFDAASISEIRLVRGLFGADAAIYFMHPIKAPEAIREAYINHDIRAFVLDYDGELDKILHETNYAHDVELFVRIAIPKDKPGGSVATDFAAKFGASFEAGVELLRQCRLHTKKLGLSFHVGTQCGDPEIYSKAIAYARKVIDAAGVDVEVLDIGGGFPARLVTDEPLPVMEEFTAAIAKAIDEFGFGQTQLLCEIGRGLVASAGSLIVRVEGRKGDLLYLNDGVYGGFLEAGGAVGLRYPVRHIPKVPSVEESPMMGFRLAGPTCDSIDMMSGPFMLPENIAVGDWIRLEQLGAYGEVSRTDFNGFGTVLKIINMEGAEELFLEQPEQVQFELA